MEFCQRVIAGQARCEGLAGFGQMIELEVDVTELVVGVGIVWIDFDRPLQTGESFLIALFERQKVAEIVVVDGFLGSCSHGRLGVHEGHLVVTELHFNDGQVPQDRRIIRIDVQSGAEGFSGFLLPAELQEADSIIGEPHHLGGTALPPPARGKD